MLRFITVSLVLFIASTQAAREENCDYGPALYQLTPPVDHAECPTWDGRNNNLYFVDIHAGNIHRYNHNTGKLTTVHIPGDVAPVIPTESDPDILIVGVNRSLVAIEWKQDADEISKQKVLVTVSEDKPDSRMNDGKVDDQGRLWIGTMGINGTDTPNLGVLYKITKGQVTKPEVMLDQLTIGNGCAWNKAKNKFYYIDSPTHKVMEYQYNKVCGKISNPRVALDLLKYNLNVHPDGMTIDKDDKLWVALYGGGSVIKVDPAKGTILQRVPIPAADVTSVMWGGPDLDVLFVTTSRVDLDETGIVQQPGAGSVFALTNLGTSGLPMYNADIIDCI